VSDEAAKREFITTEAEGVVLAFARILVAFRHHLKHNISFDVHNCRSPVEPLQIETTGHE
jgi:hypothetical protein